MQQTLSIQRQDQLAKAATPPSSHFVISRNKKILSTICNLIFTQQAGSKRSAFHETHILVRSEKGRSEKAPNTYIQQYMADTPAHTAETRTTTCHHTILLSTAVVRCCCGRTSFESTVLLLYIMLPLLLDIMRLQKYRRSVYTTQQSSSLGTQRTNKMGHGEKFTAKYYHVWFYPAANGSLTCLARRRLWVAPAVRLISLVTVVWSNSRNNTRPTWRHE